MAEAQNAKDYWSTTDFQKREYDEFPPFYILAIRRVIESLAVETVFEFGCNAGRNLEYLSKNLTRPVTLRGIDINQTSIEFGKEKWNLDLRVSDEKFFRILADNTYDLIFTVSVLDHIPDITECLRDIYRVTSRFFLTLEPYQEIELPYLQSFQSENVIASDISTKTPYSYTHPLDDLIISAGFTEQISLPLPTYRGNFGPLYRLSLWVKDAFEQSDRTRFKIIQDELIFECVLSTISLAEKARNLLRQSQKFSRQAYQLKKQLKKSSS